jgi:hypothetical protein
MIFGVGPTRNAVVIAQATGSGETFAIRSAVRPYRRPPTIVLTTMMTTMTAMTSSTSLVNVMSAL